MTAPEPVVPPSRLMHNHHASEECVAGWPPICPAWGLGDRAAYQGTTSAHEGPMHGPAVENAHAPWCTPSNPCEGSLCDGTIRRFALTAPEPVVLTDGEVERSCEVMHDAYERAAVGAGWQTQEASRKPWSDVPEANKATMRAAVRALLTYRADRLAADRSAHEALRRSVTGLADELAAWKRAWPSHPHWSAWDCSEKDLREALAATAPTPPQDEREFDCMFHDEGIPDAPCNCSDGKVRYGSHEIVTPPQDPTTTGPTR